jgi:hypothetical protein
LPIILGIGGLYFATPEKIEEAKLNIWGTRAHAIVTNVRTRGPTPGDHNIFTPNVYYMATFRFEDPTGAFHESTDGYSYGHPIKAGDAFDIVLLPSNPASWRTVETLNDPLSITFYLFFIVSLIFGISRLLKFMKMRKSHQSR